MKRIILAILIAAGTSQFASGQISTGGLPLSQQYSNNAVQVPSNAYPLPDWQKALEGNKRKAAAGIVTPYIVGLFTPTDIHFPESGSFTNLADGRKIWKTQIRIEGAPAIGLYYDAFHLPKGVSYFITNENGNHILGAYTEKNNQGDVFANEPVQGNVANLEIDIDPNVKESDIQLHINRALVYFESISYLSKYQNSGNPVQAKPTGGSPDPYNLEGSSSTCEINATCPLGSQYQTQRKATIQLIIPIDSTGQAGACSATLINNTGNNASNCKPYILTATHCDGNNNTSSDAIPFKYMVVRFNFEKTACNSTDAATVNTLNGVNLVARANYVESAQPHINGDFMLLTLKDNIPDDWDAYLSGWNRATSAPLHLNEPQKYIGFHHPGADIKKVSSSQDINPNGTADGSDGLGTHWEMNVDSGGFEQGSSGSGLFDGNGYYIGTASVAGNPDNNCKINGKGAAALFLKTIEYSKFSYDWDYNKDGNDSFRKLKPWLDPANTNAITLNAVKANCSAGTTGIHSIEQNDLESSINLYPNPSTTGIVNTKMNFATAIDLNVEAYNIAGTKVQTFTLKQVTHQEYSFDLSGQANGIYLLKFNNGINSINKKIIIAK